MVAGGGLYQDLVWLRALCGVVVVQKYFKRLLGAFARASLGTLIVEGVEAQVVCLWVQRLAHRIRKLASRDHPYFLSVGVKVLLLLLLLEGVFRRHLEVISSILRYVLVEGEIVGLRVG